jgi:hypothetical protein
MRLLGNAKDPEFLRFFGWLRQNGVLTVSTYLLKEYSGVGSQHIAALIDTLRSSIPPRFNKIDKRIVDTFNDRHFRYNCNTEDHCHVKLVMLSFRRLALSQDPDLVRDVNRFPRYNAHASNRPSALPYE